MAIASSQDHLIELLEQRQTLVFKNPHYQPNATLVLPEGIELSRAQQFWQNCLPVVEKLFDCADFSSPLIPISNYQARAVQAPCRSPLYLKADHLLPITGSVKARGGLYELFSYAVDLARQHNILIGECLDGLLSDKAKHCFAQHKVLVGSTGNLGLSIGTIGCALGFDVEVHMSYDAKDWKKKKLRAIGARVVEHQGDYSLALAEARTLAATDELAYFVDDESSVLLMLGYAQAAEELAAQLEEQHINPTVDNPLLVLIPCGVGGAPVGISLGMKAIWGEGVYPVFVEPVDAPCFSLALLKDSAVPVQSIGLTGITAADGLAVGCASPLALAVGKYHIAACATVLDNQLYHHLNALYEMENLRLEPSAVAGLAALNSLLQADIIPTLIPNIDKATIVVWSTGGGLLPDEEFDAYRTVTEQ